MHGTKTRFGTDLAYQRDVAGMALARPAFYRPKHAPSARRTGRRKALAFKPRVTRAARSDELACCLLPVMSSARARPSAAAVMTHLVEDPTDRHVAARHVRLVDHLHLAAAIAFDAQEP
jgi:hypothetical protein